MMKQCEALEFLKHSQSNRELSKQILAAIEKGGLVTAQEVMRIAKKAGYSFSREEFEVTVRNSIVERFRAQLYRELSSRPDNWRARYQPHSLTSSKKGE